MPTRSIADSAKQSLLVNFKSDTLTTVSRDKLRALARKLGFTETQTVHFAIARLWEAAREPDDDEEMKPLTKEQLAAIRQHEPKRRGRVLGSLLK
jgi:hypothetical protein